jgi:hypothetical protein
MIVPYTLGQKIWIPQQMQIGTTLFRDHVYLEEAAVSGGSLQASYIMKLIKQM